MSKKVLFLVGSTYQLFNAITLRMTVCEGLECDLLLRSAIDWQEDMLQRLAEEKLFGKIWRPDFTKKEAEFWSQSLEEKTAIINNPLLYFGGPPVDPVYDEIYSALDPIAWKLIYFYHVLNGKKPALFQFDEGLRSYTLDLPSTDEKPHFQGEYAKTPYSSAIQAFYLYQPDLYSVSKYPYELKQMPNPRAFSNVKSTLRSVFGSVALPVEDYIYFEDYFFSERHAANDMRLFCDVASIVGKENIVVKTHPRSDVDRFALLGYKTIGRSHVPWEVQLLEEGVDRMVLISVSSTALLTPFIIFDTNIHAISLLNMFTGQNPFHSDAAFQAFFDKICQKVNQKELHYYMPHSIEELSEIFRYLRLINR